MTSLQQVAGQYHICFRFNGRRFKRSLKTKHLDKADARRVRLEETIQLVETGRLDIPDDTVDVASFLLTDGKADTNRSGSDGEPEVDPNYRTPSAPVSKTHFRLSQEYSLPRNFLSSLTAHLERSKNICQAARMSFQRNW